MSRVIKVEETEAQYIKTDDEDILKCGDIVFSNNTQFCFSCIFCQRVYGKIQEFFRHILYDHLNYLDDYQYSDEDDFSVQKILESNRSKQPPKDMEFVSVDLKENKKMAKIEKVDYMKQFEHFVTDETLIKSELIDDDEEPATVGTTRLESPKVKRSQSPPAQSNPQDILHIEIVEAPSGSEELSESEYDMDSGHPPTYSSERNSEHPNNANEDNSMYLEQGDKTQFDSEEETKHQINKDTSKTKEKVYNCPHCAKAFVSKIGVKRHVMNIHELEPNQLTCNKCSKTFKTETQLELHIKRHMGVKPHSCEICGACFSDKSNLNVHILRHKGIKPHKCTLCDKRFHSTTERKLHMRSHTGERPFVCEVCGRKFSNSGHLCSHRRRHFNEKRFQCDHCQKRFFDKKLLNDHKVMHTDERPFACDSCGATFQRKKALLQHEKLHNAVKQYVCKLCGKSFAQNAGLYSHMKYH